MLLKTGINKASLRGLMAGAMLISPALFISPIRSFFLIEANEIRILPFATFLLSVVLILSVIYLGQLGRLTREKRISLIAFAIVAMIVIVNLVISENRPATLGCLANIFSPFLAAVLIVRFSNRESFEFSLRIFSIAFVVYLVANLAIWILILNKKLPNSPGLSYARMGGTFSEPVTLGYAIASLCPIILFYISAMKNAKVRAVGIPSAVLVLFISTIATGTRGGVIILSIYVLAWLISKKRFKLIISLILLTILISPIKRFDLTIDRFRDLTDEGRTSTSAIGLEYWVDSDLNNKVFGYGFGNVYPYNLWLQQNEYSNNIFFLGSDFSFVQPHNSFIWLLLEGGILYLMASLIMIVFDLKLALFFMFARNRVIDREKARAIFFFLVFIILVNNLDSILIIYPNISFLIWYLLVGIFMHRNSLFYAPRPKYSVALVGI